MQREFSSGGIVFNNLGQVLLVKTHSIRSFNNNGDSKYWGFPKGKIEANQTTKQTALREVKEEGGIEAEIITKIGDSKYIYSRDNQKIFKVVTFYIMKYLSGDTKNHDYEVIEADWFNPEEALEKLSFTQDKNLLQKAINLHNANLLKIT